MATVIFFTGAARGLGQGMTATFLTCPDTTVIAGVRDLTSSTTAALTALPTGKGSKLIPVKVDSRSDLDAAAAIKAVESHGIDHIDTLVANAGMYTDFSTIAKVPPAAVREHVEVNGFGPLYLFQAAFPLLNKSKKPTFVGIGSAFGSIGGMDQRPYPSAAYGPSKAILHWIVRKVHFEHENFVSFVAEPGFVQTDMGNAGAQVFSFEKAFVEVKDSVAGTVKLIDEATREKSGGHLLTYDGAEFPW